MVEDWDAHEKKAADLRSRLAEIAVDMKTVVCGDDLDFDTSKETLLLDERKRGLCRVSFRRAPGIVLADQDWPERLIDDCEAAIPAEVPTSNRHRAQISDAASAAV